MTSLKIDFYFEVFKQLKHVLSYFTGVYSHWDLLELTAIFIASLVKKKIIFSSQFILPPVGRFFCEFVGRQISWGFNTKIFSAYLRYKPGFYFFSSYTIEMSKQHRLMNLTISYQTRPNLENSSFFFFLIMGKIGKFSLEQHSKSQLSTSVYIGGNNVQPNTKIQKCWENRRFFHKMVTFKFNIMNQIFHFLNF